MTRWLLVLLLLLLPSSALADDLQRILDAGVVRAGICLNFEPSGFRDSNGAPRGYDVDVARQLAEALGVRLEVVEVSSATRIPDLIADRIDVIACNITATTERAKQVDFSFPYLRTGLKLLVHRGSGVTGFDDVKPGMHFIVGRGTTGEALARQRAPQAEFLYVENPGDAVLLMQQGEADIYIEDSLAIDYIAKGHPDNFEALEGVYSSDAISFGVRKGNPDFLRWLDTFASIYVSSGRYAATYGKWWGEPPPPLTPIW